MDPLKFQIICPAASQFRIERRGQVPSFRTRIFRFSMLSALSVAAAAPPDIEPEIVDENVRAVDFDTDAAIIGVSFMTYNAPRAYVASNWSPRNTRICALVLHVILNGRTTAVEY